MQEVYQQEKVKMVQEVFNGIYTGRTAGHWQEDIP